MASPFFTLFPEATLGMSAVRINPDCAVKALWGKEREKKDKRSSGLG